MRGRGAPYVAFGSSLALPPNLAKLWMPKQP